MLLSPWRSTPSPSFLYSPPSRPYPQGTTHLFYLVPSRTITYYIGRTIRYFESYYEAHYFWCYWRIERRLKNEEGFPGLEFIELVVTPLSIFRLLLVGWVGPAEAGYEVSLGPGNTCALDYADV